MRQGQHKNRSRGRGRRQGGGGGGGNPANRVYDSNGPDVKVRGTAQTVADKYTQLARDAQSAGDTIMAESYYQFAEHYQRIVSANQAAQPQQQRRDGATEETAVEPAGTDNQPATAEAAAEAPAETQPQALEAEDNPAPAANGSEDGDWSCAPDFLKKPVETKPAAKPRRSRSPRKVAAEETNGKGGDADVAETVAPASGDAAESPSTEPTVISD